MFIPLETQIQINHRDFTFIINNIFWSILLVEKTIAWVWVTLGYSWSAVNQNSGSDSASLEDCIIRNSIITGNWCVHNIYVYYILYGRSLNNIKNWGLRFELWGTPTIFFYSYHLMRHTVKCFTLVSKPNWKVLSIPKSSLNDFKYPRGAADGILQSKLVLNMFLKFLLSLQFSPKIFLRFLFFRLFIIYYLAWLR